MPKGNIFEGVLAMIFYFLMISLQCKVTYNMSEILFEDFQKIDLRVGTVLEVKDFPSAHKPAYQLTIDFGPLGTKKSSAQITSYYTKEDLVGKQIIANVNFEEKQIANFKSQCLVLGSVDKGGVVLLNPSQKVPNGSSVQ